MIMGLILFEGVAKGTFTKQDDAEQTLLLD